MSGFAVIYQRRQEPVVPDGPADALGRMLAVLEHRGPDGAASVVDPPFAAGQRHFWVTPEEVGEEQPLVDREAELCLVYDGRLDNRSELLADLGEPVSHHRELTDAQIVLKAYRRWGGECFRRFLGPFAAVVCDRKTGGVLCARDPLGDRSLYYRLDSERLLVASEEQSVLAVPGVSAALDEDRLAHFFAVRVPDDGSTFFQEISELRAGHLLRVAAEGSSVERYFHPEVPEPIHCPDERDYALRYLELLRQSVACRLRSTSRVGVMMSGGLDSTSLVALAAKEDAAAVRPASWVFDELESCDERRFMDPMLGLCGLDAIRSQGDGLWPLRRSEDYAVNPNAPEENAYRGLKRRLYRSVAAEGCRALLNGGSADLLYFGYQRWLGDLLREGRLVEAAAGGWVELRRRGLASVAQTIVRKLGRRRGRGGASVQATAWLTREARRRLGRSDDGRWVDWRRPAQCRNVFGARQAHSLAREVFHANREGIDLRHPYRDRRLIDFMLAIPAHQLYRRGHFKHVVRRAMRGWLPPVILERSDRTQLTPLFDRGLWDREAQQVNEILAAPDAVWPRFVRRDWLEEVQRRSAREPNVPIVPIVLWQCVAFELWRRRWGRC